MRRGLPSHVEKVVKERAIRTMRLAFKRAIKRSAMPKWAEHARHKKVFLRIYRKAAIKNYYSHAYNRSGERYHVDHIIPLAGKGICGLMVPWNLHVIPATVNIAKGTIIVEEWHNKMPDDGRKQLRAAQEKNLYKSRLYLERKRAKVILDSLFM